jgi:hypothetical protein
MKASKSIKKGMMLAADQYGKFVNMPVRVE